MPHDPHFHDCPHVIVDKPCGGKASDPRWEGPRCVQMHALRKGHIGS